MNHTKNTYQHQQLRRRRNRMRVLAHTKNPVLIVFRSSKHISAQIVDLTGKILVSASDLEIKKSKMTKTEKAALVGELIAKKAKTSKISAIAFDRGEYRYHGRVKALASAARKEGLQF